MKVLYQSRTELFDVRGGDTMQVVKTKEAIEKIDSTIQIDISTEIKPKNISEYDIVHLFNLDWISETYVQAKWAKKHNKPVVLSAIHHSETEIKLYEKLARYDIRRISNFFLPWQSLRDTAKNVYRSIFYPKKIYPTLLQIIHGIRNTQRDILKNSDVVLVQTHIEQADIKKDFNFDKFESVKVVNGVDIETLKNTDNNGFKKIMNEKYNVDINKHKILLNVGRIEPRKNQLSLINAFINLKNKGELEDYILVFIGNLANRSFEYRNKFEKLVKNNEMIFHLGEQKFSMVASAMKSDGIYVQPSWFETTGLVSIEAAYCGMKVVAAGDRVKEYLGDYAEYCLPESLDSIENAILKTSKSAMVSDNMREKISREYTWNNTANQTISVYKKLQ